MSQKSNGFGHVIECEVHYLWGGGRGGGGAYVVNRLLNGMPSFEKGTAMFVVKMTNIQNALVMMRLDYVFMIGMSSSV